MTSEQAMAGLASLVGGGGISAIMVAVFAFLTEARKGRKPSDGSVAIAIGQGLAQGKWDEEAVGHLSTIAYALTKMVAINEIQAEEAIDDKSFHDRLETKIGRLMIEAMRASMDAKP